MQVKRALRAHAEMHVILLRLSDNNELAVTDSTGNCIGLNTIATAESNSALDQLRSDFEEVFPDQLPACLPPRRCNRGKFMQEVNEVYFVGWGKRGLYTRKATGRVMGFISIIL
jgi:hypothetical protein